jgi:hypothetical protein
MGLDVNEAWCDGEAVGNNDLFRIGSRPHLADVRFTADSGRASGVYESMTWLAFMRPSLGQPFAANGARDIRLIGRPRCKSHL